MKGSPWTREEIALLGTMTDREVAERIGRSKGAVKIYRQKRGIAACPDWVNRKLRVLRPRACKECGADIDPQRFCKRFCGECVKQKDRDYSLAYQKANPERVNANHKEWRRQQSLVNPVFRVNQSAHSREYWARKRRRSENNTLTKLLTQNEQPGD